MTSLEEFDRFFFFSVRVRLSKLERAPRAFLRREFNRRVIIMQRASERARKNRLLGVICSSNDPPFSLARTREINSLAISSTRPSIENGRDVARCSAFAILADRVILELAAIFSRLPRRQRASERAGQLPTSAASRKTLTSHGSGLRTYDSERRDDRAGR